MPRAVLIGGNGMIGRAAARALAGDGWEVVAVSRSGSLPEGLAELGVEAVVADREDDAQLRAALAGGAEVLFDSMAFGREHGEQLNGLEGPVGSLVLNAGAPDPPTTLEICRAIGDALGHEFEPVLLPRGEYENPWAAEQPFVVSMAAAEQELGYRPVTTYPEAVRETCAWLVAELEGGRNWDGTYLEEMLDYAAEDEVLAAQS